MKKLLNFLLILFFLPALGFCADVTDAPKAKEEVPKIQSLSLEEAQALTLDDCYKLALKESELIAIDAERIKEAEAHFLEAFGTILPQVSFSRTDTRQAAGTSTSPRKFFEEQFVFKQALFSGFKEFAGMAGSHFEKKQRVNEKIRAEQLLFTDVSDAFYLLLEIREDLKALEAIKKAFTDRIDELKSRVDIGKSRNSEVVSTETQLYSLEDEIEADKDQELVALELLEFLVGRSVDQISESGMDFTLKPESEYLAKASLRPDVQAADFAWKVGQKQVAIAKSGFLPTLNLETDYFPHRSASLQNNNWAAMLTLDVPIFEGTTTFGQVKEARAQARESELTFQRAGRLAAQDIHDSYVNVQADILRTSILQKALKSAELNYHLQIEDYKLSVVNNLDVLAAIQSLESVRRNFIHISYESKRFYWQLLVAAGEINIEP